MVNDGVTLSEEEIRGALSRADLLSRNDADRLRVDYPEWVAVIEYLTDGKCPVTYLPIAAILMTARSMRPESELDVLAIQRQEGPKGYSAASIGGIIISFATEQGVSLRSTSSQVVNNQPFTYKQRIEPGMSGASKSEQYARFYEAACAINALTQQEAREVLALIFAMCRSVALDVHQFEVTEMDWNQSRARFELDATFVDEHSDNGRVGLTFTASLLELLYGTASVFMGHNSDPDVTSPGDVQVVIDGETWLWVEVKQKSVTTGGVQTFMEKVQAIGGTRILYCALANANYPSNIDHRRLQRLAEKKGVELTIVESPMELVDLLLPRCPGEPGALVAKMADAMMRRLGEAGAAVETSVIFEALNTQFTASNRPLM